MNLPLRRRNARIRHARQRGAVAILVGVSLVVMLGFVGLALDGGHLYLTKTELQNAADACALAGAYELTSTPTVTVTAATRAEAGGKYVGNRNRVDFQGTAIGPGTITMAFATSLTGVWKPASDVTPNAKYVRCTIQRSGITPWFMQVLGFGDQTVRALATATLRRSQTNCAVPMALCVKGSGANFGYTVGDWIAIDFASGPLTGNFRWVDFSPPSGGVSEIAAQLNGSGQCSLPQPITGGCPSSSSSLPAACVGQSGGGTALEDPYNSRFGVYKNPGDVTTYAPDFTGYAYAWDGVAGGPGVGNWPLGRNASAGSSGGIPNFLAARAAHLGTNNVVGSDTEFFFQSPPYGATSVANHTTHGADRRLVTMPIVDCSYFSGGGGHAPIRSYACVLLLDTYRKSSSATLTKAEFLGLAGDDGSPCASSGIAGDATSIGPLVPTLLQ